MYRTTIVLLLSLSLSGCLSSWDSKGLTGDFDGMVKDFEMQGGYERFDNPENYRVILWVCEAFFQQRERTQYDECTARMWKLIPEEWYQINDHDMKSTLLTRRAELRLEIQDYEEAAALVDQAIEELEQGRSMELEGTSHIAAFVRVHQVSGIVSAFMGDRPKALAAIEKIDGAIATGEVWGGRDQFTEEFEFGLRRDAMAAIYIALKDYQQAIDTYASIYTRKRTFNSVMDSITTFGLQSTLEDIAKDLTKNYHNSLRIPVYFAQAKANIELGNTDVAKPILDELLAMSVIRGFSEIYAASNYERGRIARLEGDLEGAAEYFEKSLNEIEKQRSSVNTEAGRIGFAGDNQLVYWDAVETLLELGRPTEAFSYAERAKSRALVDMLAEKSSFGSVGGDRNKLANSIVESLKKSDRDAQLYTKQDFQVLSRGARSANASTLETVIPDKELASLVTVTSTGLTELQAQLQDDETLIEYYGSGDSLVAFVVHQSDLSVVSLDGTSLSEDIALFREELRDPGNDDFAYYSEKLYATLIQPLLGKLTTRQLVIVPHGALHYLPFSALGAERQQLVQGYSYRIIPSASVLNFLQQKERAQEGLLVFGNPDLDDPELDLPFAEDEAKAIAASHPSAKMLTRKEATETQLRRVAQNHRQLHIASHGVFDAAVPLNSRLLLAADQSNDGNLTVSELYEMELDADIVILSACETGLGDVANGDDVVGFSRGFFFAGARTIVSSLWQVDDYATMQLMLKFYEEVETKPAREALQLAQQHLIDEGYTHPFYWSAFQVSGAGS